MSHNLTLKILQAIGEQAVDSLDLCVAIVTAGYGASRGKIEHAYRKVRQRRTESAALTHNDEEVLKRYHKLLSKLKREGLIESRIEQGGKLFSLTQKGRKKRDLLAEKQLPSSRYERIPDTHVIIVAFDIPERERRKRDWIRSVLKELGLTLVQKSLWIGKIKIPQGFLEDLRDLKLIQYVEIFQVEKTGSLRQIT